MASEPVHEDGTEEGLLVRGLFGLIVKVEGGRGEGGGEPGTGDWHPQPNLALS